ncbi:MAG: glutathione peroxidase [Clostridia bacterium]|nr:glutathione peroxidase [Clostridia bacterium]
MTVYDFKVKDMNGEEVSLKDYEGKVLLIVNTATECGFTPQYTELQEMYDAYHDRGLEILDFPCNQFGNQAPGSNDDIHTFCTGRFGISFPQFGKVDVNGENADPLFLYLEENAPFKGFDNNPQGIAMKAFLSAKDKDYKKTNTIKWNFTKFLIAKDGTIIDRFEPTRNMKKVSEAVESAL